jgi:hypothetical protein
MSELAPALESAPLSVEDAVSALDAEPVEQAEAPEAEPAEEAPPEDVQAEEGEEPAAEEETAEEPDVPAVDAPLYWDAEAKAKFAELPPELQAVVAEQERSREVKFQTLQQQAVEARKAAAAHAEKLAGLAQTVEQAVQTAEQHHARVVPELGMTWEQVDWPAWFEQDPQTAATYRAKYDVERETLQKLDASRQQAAASALAEFRQQENAKLAGLAPDLTDPKEGPRRLEATLQFIVQQGVPQDHIPRLSAVELSIAHDAMRWREAQAKASALKSAPKQPAPTAKPVKPAAAASVRPHREADVAKNRFAQTRSVADAVALLNARG